MILTKVLVLLEVCDGDLDFTITKLFKGHFLPNLTVSKIFRCPNLSGTPCIYIISYYKGILHKNNRLAHQFCYVLVMSFYM